MSIVDALNKLKKKKKLKEAVNGAAEKVANTTQKETNQSNKKDVSAKVKRLKELSKISEKPNAKYTIGNTKYKVDKAGTATTTSDGYIFPTRKGAEYVEKARKNGIKMNYTDPTYGNNHPESKLPNIETKNKLKKKKK